MANTILIKRKTTTGAPSPASLQTGELCLVVPDKQVFVKNDDGTVTLLNTAKTNYILTTTYVSTSVTRASVPGMSCAVTAGKKYRIELLGDYQSVALTTGGSIGFVLTSGAGTIRGFATMAISQVTGAGDLTTTIRAINATNTTAGSFMTSTGVSVINSPHYLVSELILDCTATGVFQLQFGSEVAGSSAQLNVGTVMTVEVLN